MVEMKFNLKNRPKPDKNDIPTVEDFNDYEEWFEGFEKELRETLEDPLAEHGLHKQTKQLIQEILGIK